MPVEKTDLIEQAANIAARECFTAEYANTTDIETRKVEGLGIALSQWAEWDGLKLLKVLYAALEDSNFHTENESIQAMIDKLEKG